MWAGQWLPLPDMAALAPDPSLSVAGVAGVGKRCPWRPAFNSPCPRGAVIQFGAGSGGPRA